MLDRFPCCLTEGQGPQCTQEAPWRLHVVLQGHAREGQGRRPEHVCYRHWQAVGRAVEGSQRGGQEEVSVRGWGGYKVVEEGKQLGLDEKVFGLLCADGHINEIGSLLRLVAILPEEQQYLHWGLL